MDPVATLDRATRKRVSDVDRDQARFLVDTYYRWQEHRIALRNQQRALAAAGLDTAVVGFFADQAETLEKQMVKVLDEWTDTLPVGRWAKQQKGIGPVLAAGLSAHIDITKARTAGAVWRFAGLDPTVKWEKGQKRPWNADLRVLCWRIGDSFVKQSNREGAFYGACYRERKEFELARDERGENGAAAAASLGSRTVKDPALRKVLESGHLPAGQLDLRARRWAVKLFLAHWFEVAYEAHHGEPPPVPYPIAIQGHAHQIAPPGWVPAVIATDGEVIQYEREDGDEDL